MFIKATDCHSNTPVFINALQVRFMQCCPFYPSQVNAVHELT